MINELLLLSNNDIPFKEAQTIIHVPTLKEIALIGEKSFNIGCQFLNFTKELLSEKDKSNLVETSDFEIFMSVMNAREKIEYKTDSMMVLSLLFPNSNIKILNDKILITSLEGLESEINKDNFQSFKDIICNIFCLNKREESDYNPADAMARKIAEKFKKRHEQLGRQRMDSNAENIKVSIYMRYVSILAVGLKKDMNSLMNYTVYQIIDEFTRFQKKQDFDMYIKAKMAGASDLEEVDSWMEDIHP